MKKTYCRLRVLADNPNKISIDSVFANDGTRVRQDCWLRFKTYICEHVDDFLGKEFIKIIKNLDFYSSDDCEWLDMMDVSGYYDKVIQDIEVNHEYYIVITIKPDIKIDMEKHISNTTYGIPDELITTGRNPWKSNKDPKGCYIIPRTWRQDALTEYFAKKSDVLDKGTIDGKTWDYMTRDEWYNIIRDEEVTKMEKKESPKELQKKHIDRSRGRLDDIHIKRVIFNDKATILFFTGGSKSVVKCTETDNYSKEAGIALAYLKHVVGDDQFHWVMDALMGKKGATIKSLYDTKISIIDKTNKES